jgi:hypothetical protein
MGTGCAYQQPSHHEVSIMDELWLSHFYNELPEKAHQQAEWEDYREAYRFGQRVSRHFAAPYHRVEGQLVAIWDDMIGPGNLSWDDVQPVVEHAYSEAWQGAGALVAA